MSLFGGRRHIGIWMLCQELTDESACRAVGCIRPLIAPTSPASVQQPTRRPSTRRLMSTQIINYGEGYEIAGGCFTVLGGQRVWCRLSVLGLTCLTARLGSGACLLGLVILLIKKPSENPVPLYRWRWVAGIYFLGQFPSSQ
jgi:hypothetical protein